MTTTTLSENDVLAELEAARAALLDPLDLPHVWTQDRVDAYEARRVAIGDLLTKIRAEADIIADRTPRRTALQLDRDLLLRLKAAIEQQIEDALDHRLIADRRASTEAWSQKQALLASRRALDHGVEYFGGRPALPAPLVELLGDEVWPGGLIEVEARMERMAAVVRMHREQRNKLLLDAAAFLEVNDAPA